MVAAIVIKSTAMTYSRSIRSGAHWANQSMPMPSVIGSAAFPSGSIYANGLFAQ